jgi:hypothetical protein
MAYPKSDLEVQICREISKEIGAPVEEIMSIVRTQSKYTTYMMEHSGFETVSLPYLGKFHVKPGRLKKLNESMANRRLDEQTQTWESSQKKTTK